MDLTLKKTASQIQFWGLLGPFVALVTLMVLLMNSTSQGIPLSFAILAGIVVCWRWQIRGFLISCAALAGLYLFQFDNIASEEHLWHIGMNVAIILALGVTALSYQEIADVFQTSYQETSDHLNLLIQEEKKWKEAKNLIESERNELAASLKLIKADVAEKESNLHAFTERLNTLLAEEQKWQQSQSELLAEREQLNTSLEMTRQDALAKEAQIKSYFELVDSARQEVVRVNLEHEKLLQELFHKQHDIAAFEEKLRESQEVINLLSTSRNVAENFEEKLHQKNYEIQTLKDALKQSEERLFEVTQLKEENLRLENEATNLKLKLDSVQGTLETNQELFEQFDSEKETLRLALCNLEERLQENNLAIQQLQDEKNSLMTTYSTLSQEYEDFKVQSAEARIFKELSLLEKIEQISINEKALYGENEQLKALNRDLEALLKEKEVEISEALLSQDKALQSQIHALEAKGNAIALEKVQLEENVQRLKLDLKAKENELAEALYQQEMAYQTQLATIQGRFQKLQADNHELEAEISRLKQDLELSLEDNKELARLKDKAFHEQMTLIVSDKEKLEEERDALFREISEVKETFANRESVSQIQTTALKQAYENKIEHYEQQIKQLTTEKEMLIASSKVTDSHQVSLERRKVEGMLNQLREQFNEKSKVLDQTRQELFLAKEEFARLQKEQEEGQIEAASVMENYLLQVVKDSEATSEELSKEIVALQELVDTLMNSKA